MAREENGPTKAMVLAELATGDSISAVAKRHNINKGTVSRWNREVPTLVPTAPVAVVAQPDATQKRRREIGEQLYDYMQTSVETLTAQLRLFGTVDWLQKQPAGELATLHGVVADKTARLLAAYQRGIESGDDEAAGD
jgi:hypothetical protein